MAGSTIALLSLVAIVLIAAAVAVGWTVNSRLGRSSLRSAQTEAQRLLEEVARKADGERKAAALTAKDEWYRTKKQLERESRERQKNIVKLQKDLEDGQAELQEKANQLRRRDQSLKDRERRLTEADQEAEQTARNADRLLQEAREKLEKISGLSVEEAKKVLLTNLKNETR